MKLSLLVFFSCLINCCSAQSILDFFKVKEIKQIEIRFSPSMDVENGVTKISNDSNFINQIKVLLEKLPDTGQLNKSFPETIPTWEILITDQNEDSHKLVIYGIKLRAPNSSGGTFYGGIENHEFEKELYLEIRKFMIGNWYNCN